MSLHKLCTSTLQGLLKCLENSADQILQAMPRPQPLQYEPITTLGKLGIIRGFHFLDPLGGLGSGLGFKLSLMPQPASKPIAALQTHDPERPGNKPWSELLRGGLYRGLSGGLL